MLIHGPSISKIHIPHASMVNVKATAVPASPGFVALVVGCPGAECSMASAAEQFEFPDCVNGPLKNFTICDTTSSTSWAEPFCQSTSCDKPLAKTPQAPSREQRRWSASSRSRTSAASPATSTQASLASAFPRTNGGKSSFTGWPSSSPSRRSPARATSLTRHPSRSPSPWAPLLTMN